MAEAKKRQAHELPVPPAVEADERAVEMLRVWIAGGGLHCTLNIGHWQHSGIDEDLAWGKVLADTIRHLANVLESETGTEPEETIRRVLKALEVELDDAAPRPVRRCP